MYLLNPLLAMISLDFFNFIFFWQVDLFFYREPEESKEQEQEEVPALPDYAADFSGAGGDWPTNQIADAHWNPDAVSTPAVGSGWSAGDAG